MELGFVVVPLRNRPVQLENFMSQMVPYLASLSTADKMWRILIVEQPPGLPFNRGLLFNVAACVLTKLVDGIKLNLLPHDENTGAVVITCCSAALSITSSSERGGVRAVLKRYESCGAHQHSTNSSSSSTNILRTHTCHTTASSSSGNSMGENKSVEELESLMKTARSIFMILHDVDVLPRGRHFDLQVNGGKPCNYFAPARGDVVHLYGHRHSLGGVASILLNDFNSVDGFPLSCWGWGWEDVALANRCTGKLRIIRDSTFIDRLLQRPHLCAMTEVDMPHSRRDREALLRVNP
eukprot:Lankesteria_metandrocarpae@DN4848_c1_g1_i5.p1